MTARHRIADQASLPRNRPDFCFRDPKRKLTHARFAQGYLAMEGRIYSRGRSRRGALLGAGVTPRAEHVPGASGGGESRGLPAQAADA